jgi:hypothetical protein
VEPYAVTGILPEKDGQPEYRIKHSSEEFERIAQEGELSRARVTVVLCNGFTAGALILRKSGKKSPSGLSPIGERCCGAPTFVAC